MGFSEGAEGEGGEEGEGLKFSKVGDSDFFACDESALNERKMEGGREEGKGKGRERLVHAFSFVKGFVFVLDATRRRKRVCMGYEPSDSIPSFVSHVKDEILGVGVDWTSENGVPVLEVRPGLVGGGSGEGRVAGSTDANQKEEEQVSSVEGGEKRARSMGNGRREGRGTNKNSKRMQPRDQ